MLKKVIRNQLLPYWKSMIVILAPLLALPLLIVVNTKVSQLKFYLRQCSAQFILDSLIEEFLDLLIGGSSWLCHCYHGRFLDDRSSAIGRNQFDACRVATFTWHHEHRGSVHGLHEGKFHDVRRWNDPSTGRGTM